MHPAGAAAHRHSPRTVEFTSGQVLAPNIRAGTTQRCDGGGRWSCGRPSHCRPPGDKSRLPDPHLRLANLANRRASAAPFCPVKGRFPSTGGPPDHNGTNAQFQPNSSRCNRDHPPPSSTIAASAFIKSPRIAQGPHRTVQTLRFGRQLSSRPSPAGGQSRPMSDCPNRAHWPTLLTSRLVSGAQHDPH